MKPDASAVRFRIRKKDGHSCARLASLNTPHGSVQTPLFMPIGTRGTVKGLTPQQLRAAGTTMLLANTYHLALRPGAEVVARLGGLHRFMAWDGPILTDSGGYQVFSLAALNTIDDTGVTFNSHIDGAPARLDPDRVIAIQEQLGADIIMAFDQCPALPASRATLQEAVERTVRWARRCRKAQTRSDQALFGIVQGGLDVDLRRRCLDDLVAMDFAGYAIGGLSVGEPPENTLELLRRFVGYMPPNRPRYLMGVGRPIDIIRAVACGIDLFDCVLPTRNGRNSFAFTACGTLRLRNAGYRDDDRPLETGCECYTCTRFSRGYLRHLFLAGEMLGPILVSLHNIAYYHRWLKRIRQAIASETFGRLLSECEAAAQQKEDTECTQS